MSQFDMEEPHRELLRDRRSGADGKLAFGPTAKLPLDEGSNRDQRRVEHQPLSWNASPTLEGGSGAVRWQARRALGRVTAVDAPR
jgi:hypothetical protein